MTRWSYRDSRSAFDTWYWETEARYLIKERRSSISSWWEYLGLTKFSFLRWVTSVVVPSGKRALTLKQYLVKLPRREPTKFL